MIEGLKSQAHGEAVTATFLSVADAIIVYAHLRSSIPGDLIPLALPLELLFTGLAAYLWGRVGVLRQAAKILRKQ